MFCLDYCYPFLGCCFFLETTGLSLDFVSPFLLAAFHDQHWVGLTFPIYKASYACIHYTVTYFYLLLYLHIFLWISFYFFFPSFVALGFHRCGLSLVGSEQGYSFCSVWASHCCGFSCGALYSGNEAFSGCGHRLSCSTVFGIFLGPDEPMSAALVYIFIHWTTRSLTFYFFKGRNFMLPSVWYIGIQWKIDSK